MVWAVDEAHLVNFLTPRDCPRITYGPGPDTTPEDIARFLSPGLRRVVAFEAVWLERVRTATLYIYELPVATFEPELPEAGYWISRRPVAPLGCEVVSDLLAALVQAGAEVRVLKDFWSLCDAVSASTLEFSVIRKDNARSRRV